MTRLGGRITPIRCDCANQNTISLGSENINAAKYASQLFQSIQPVRVHSRQEAIDAVVGESQR